MSDKVLKIIKVNDIDFDVITNNSGDLYKNIYICGKTGSGKSLIALNIIKHMIHVPDLIVFFSSTVDKDPVQKKIKSFMKKNDVEIEITTELKNINIYTELEGEKIFFFDDIGDKMVHDDTLVQLLKTRRHHMINNIICSQNFNDIPLGGRRQVNLLILLKGFGKDKLKQIYDELLTYMDFDFQFFLELYKDATYDKFDFITIDIDNNKLYKGLNYLYQIKDEEDEEDDELNQEDDKLDDELNNM